MNDPDWIASSQPQTEVVELEVWISLSKTNQFKTNDYGYGLLHESAIQWNWSWN